MYLQTSEVFSNIPLSKLTAQAIAILLLIGMVLYFVLKVVTSQHSTIMKLIEKIYSRNRE